MILIISSGICVLFLLVHSLYFRPLRATLLILFFCIAPAALYGDLYDFQMKTAVIKLGKGIPVVQIVGFFFAFYCALTIATHIVERRADDGRRTAPYFSLLVWTVFITIFIGVGIEYANFTIKWWTWRSYVTVGKIMLVGVWGWRPLLAMPLLLQFFIDRDFKAKFHPGWRLWFFAPAAVIAWIMMHHREHELHLIVFICLAAFAVLFLWFMAADVAPVVAAVFRHRELRVVVPACLVWFFAFLIWMIWVDRVPLLQAMTLPLWPSLLLLARIKSPIVSLDKFQFETPKSLFGRRRAVDLNEA